jgi:hypothetical protein
MTAADDVSYDDVLTRSIFERLELLDRTSSNI